MFDFPKTDRTLLTKFKRNYLKSVIFQVRFQPNNLILENKDEIIKKFVDTLPRTQVLKSQGFGIAFKVDQTPIVQSISDQENGYELKSKDGQKVLSITIDTITFTISGNSYSNFETFLHEINKLNEIIDTCKIDHFTRLAIRKINVIDFRMPDTDENCPMDLLGYILNQDLLSNVSYFPSTNYINQNLHTINFVKNDSRLNLRYGLLVPDIKTKKGQIIIDIDLFKVGNLDKNTGVELFREINTEIFNIFTWSLSEEAINELQK